MGCTLGDVKKWFQDKGDQTHRLNYPLSSKSIVIDLGAYEGKWAEKIIAKYNCKVLAYEPVRNFYEQTKRLLAKYPTAQVFHYGLASTTEDAIIYLAADGSSLYDQQGQKEAIHLKDIRIELQERKLTSVDLLKVNIEGAEYPLFEYLIDQGLQSVFKDIQVQFHILDETSAARRDRIRAQLSKTHVLTYDYPFVWENWRRK